MLKILFIPNLLNSALGLIAQDLKKFWDYALIPAQIDIITIDNITKNTLLKYDHILVMYFLDAKKVATLIDPKKILTGIHSHYIFNPTTTPSFDPSPPFNFIQELKKYKKINVVSKRLEKIFMPYMDVFYTKCGIDQTVFKSLQRNLTDKIILGWVGHSKKTSKGYDSIIKPLLSEVDTTKFSFKIIDIANGIKKNREDMNKFYNEIDLLLVSSNDEGQPLPPIEAGICGVPSISTNVGIIPELIQNKISGYIVNPHYEKFLEKISSLTKENIKFLGKNIQKEVKENWIWEKLIYNWMTFIVGEIK